MVFVFADSKFLRNETSANSEGNLYLKINFKATSGKIIVKNLSTTTDLKKSLNTAGTRKFQKVSEALISKQEKSGWFEQLLTSRGTLAG